MGTSQPGHVIALDVGVARNISAVNQTRIVGGYSAGGGCPADVPTVNAAGTELNPEEMILSAVEDLGGSDEGTLDVVVLVDVSGHSLASYRTDPDGVRNPLVEDDLQRDGSWPEMAVELDLEEISLDESVDGYALVLRQSESLGGDCQRNLALLEVVVGWGEYCHDCLQRV